MVIANRRKHSQKQKQKRRGGARGGSSGVQTLARQLAGTLYQPVVDGPPLDSAIDAELMASDVLALLAVTEDLPDAAAIWSAVGQELIHRVEARPMPNAVALLHGLDLVAPPELARRAHAAIERLEKNGGRRPAWASGPAQFRRGWIGADDYGDREVVVAEFRHPGQRPHVLTLLLDPNLGGLLKDVAILERANECLRGWSRRAPEVRFRQATAEQVGGRLGRGLDAAERYAGDGLVQEDVASARALLLARLRALPAGEEESLEPELDDEARAALIESFARSPEARCLPDAELVAERAVAFKVDYGDGDPLRWSPELVAGFLLDWFPRKVTMIGQTVEWVPDALRAWVRFAGRQKGLAGRLISSTEQEVEANRQEFLRAWDDPSSYGPAKAMVLALTRQGIDPLDRDAVQGWIHSHRDIPWTEWLEPEGSRQTLRVR